MEYIKNYVKQMRENCVKDNNGNIVCSPELWEEIASTLEAHSHVQMPRKSRTAEEVINNFKGMAQITEIANTIANECCLNCMWCNYAVLQHAEAIYAAGYQKKQEWISVEDRLPEAKPQSDELIIRTGDGTVGAGRYCIYKTPDGYEGVFSWMENEGIDFCSLGTDSKVTHWMPLPDLPPKLLKGGR